jgi:hypothetical protein
MYRFTKDNRFSRLVSNAESRRWRRIIDLRTYSCKQKIGLAKKKSFVFDYAAQNQRDRGSPKNVCLEKSSEMSPSA